jgi:hypothetical protein
MKKNLLVAAFAVSSVLASASISRAQSTFPDVPDNHWAAQAVKKLAAAGIIEGFPANQKAASRTASKATPRTATAARKSSVRSAKVASAQAARK